MTDFEHKLKRYGFTDQHGHPLENCAEYRELLDSRTEILKALSAAERFITNGIEFGYIRCPDPETPDSAHKVLPMVQQAICRGYGIK